MKSQYRHGLIKGLPIAFGYLPVSFTFGFMAVNSGIPIWLAVFISMSNLTSSGQFAGTNLVIAGAGYLEITLTTFIINIRYILMSLALSQKMDRGVKLLDRMIFSFGITDETFAVASSEIKPLTTPYMYGLVTGPYIGWALGTLLGGCTSSILPDILKGAMGIALFAMFIAIIIPPAKKSASILIIIAISITISCIIKYVPFLYFISDGFRTIIATIIAAGIGAFLFPAEEKENITND